MDCTKCNDMGEFKKPVSEYIRQLDVETGHADRPAFTTVFCTCKQGKAQLGRRTRRSSLKTYRETSAVGPSTR